MLTSISQHYQQCLSRMKFVRWNFVTLATTLLGKFTFPKKIRTNHCTRAIHKIEIQQIHLWGCDFAENHAAHINSIYTNYYSAFKNVFYLSFESFKVYLLLSHEIEIRVITWIITAFFFLIRLYKKYNNQCEPNAPPIRQIDGNVIFYKNNFSTSKMLFYFHDMSEFQPK